MVGYGGPRCCDMMVASRAADAEADDDREEEEEELVVSVVCGYEDAVRCDGACPRACPAVAFTTAAILAYVSASMQST